MGQMKNKGLYLIQQPPINIIVPSFFSFNPFWRLEGRNQTIILFVFCSNEKNKICFWNLLTFSMKKLWQTFKGLHSIAPSKIFHNWLKTLPCQNLHQFQLMLILGYPGTYVLWCCCNIFQKLLFRWALSILCHKWS